MCKKGQLLEPREREAFDAGNKIWGSRSGGKREQHQHQHHRLLGETRDNDIREKEKEEEEDPEKDPKEDPPHDPNEEDDPLARFHC